MWLVSRNVILEIICKGEGGQGWDYVCCHEEGESIHQIFITSAYTSLLWAQMNRWARIREIKEIEDMGTMYK